MPQPFDIFKIAKDGEPVWLEAAQSLEAAAKRVNTQRDCALGDYMIFSQRTTMSTGFLDRLATQLKVNKNPACRRGIQRILAALKKNFEDRKYQSHVEAESDFRQLVSREEACK